MMTLALTSGYFVSNSYTMGSALSCSSATDSKISKLGYSCLNEDSRFSKRLVSRPFKGLKMDTPGAEDSKGVVNCWFGRLLYFLRLTTAGSEHLNERQQLAHAVQHPNSPADQIIPYQVSPTMERQTPKRWYRSCVVVELLWSIVGLIMGSWIRHHAALALWHHA